MFLLQLFLLCEILVVAVSMPWPFEAGDAVSKAEELADEQEKYLIGKRVPVTGTLDKRGHTLSESRKWPTTVKDGKIIVPIPYTIDSSLGSRFKYEIGRAVKEMDQKTCIRFVQRNGETDFVEYVLHDTQCSAPVGRPGGKSVVRLTTGCSYKGKVLHEMMHVLGFLHEHQRKDRDQYLRIYEDNILDDYDSQILATYDMDTQGIAFDFKSILMYKKTAFAKNDGLVTMEARSDPSMELGNVNDFSALDLKRVNKYYGCAEQDEDYKNYGVTVKTGSGWWDGTDAILYLELIGSDGRKSGESDVAKGGSYNDFESGNNDHYTVAFKDVGRIAKLKVRLEDNPFGSWSDGWTVDKIVAQDGHMAYSFIGPKDIYPGDTVVINAS